MTIDYNITTGVAIEYLFFKPQRSFYRESDVQLQDCKCCRVETWRKKWVEEKKKKKIEREKGWRDNTQDPIHVRVQACSKGKGNDLRRIDEEWSMIESGKNRKYRHRYGSSVCMYVKAACTVGSWQLTAAAGNSQVAR